MAKIHLLYILTFFNLLSFAQDTTITIFFKSGQSNLTPTQQNSIEKLQVRPVTKITFEGYADTVGRASLNKKLSYKRAATTAKKIKTKNLTIVGKGESVEKKVSLNKMRKVVVKVWYDKPIIENKPVVIAIVEEKKKEPIVIVDPCIDDTTIYSESGSMIKINKCHYQKIKDCFKYKEYQSAKSIQEAGLRTVDESGRSIESGGMIDIGFCSDTCLKKPVIVFLPVPKCLSGQSMTLWTLNRNNSWGNSKNKIEIVKINDKEFYKMEVFCPGKINCDKPKRVRGKVKVKLKNGMKFKSASLSYNCPLYSVNAEIKKRKKVAMFPFACMKDEPIIYIKAISKNGDTLIINNESLNKYTRKRKIISRCKCETKPKEKFLSVFKIRQKYLYKKYKIFQDDFDITNTTKE